MNTTITNTPEVRAPHHRPRVDLVDPTSVAEWLADITAAVSELTFAARDGCASERVYSRSELRRRVRRASRLVHQLLAEAQPSGLGGDQGDREATQPVAPEG